jgi:hypothetical protein
MTKPKDKKEFLGNREKELSTKKNNRKGDLLGRPENLRAAKKEEPGRGPEG